MRHAAILHDLRNQLLVQDFFKTGIVAYRAIQSGGECLGFSTALSLLEDIQAQREARPGRLHYVLHPLAGGLAHLDRDGHPPTGEQQVQGQGWIHLHLEPHPPQAWLVSIECSMLPSAGAPGGLAEVTSTRTRKMIELMRRYAHGENTPNMRYWRNRP